MRAIVLLEWGPNRWQKGIIEPGQRMRIGRFERADFVVPDDDSMSGLHFELSWDGQRCFMRDLGSLHGTILNGEPASEGEVEHGGWLRAGRTVFSVFFEGNVPPWSPPSESPITAQQKASALSALRAQPSTRYAVLDAAREDRITTLLRAAPEQAQSLYDGDDGEELEDVAPYLVALPDGSWLLERLVEEGWGQGWGIYLTCDQKFADVRRHLRRLLLVMEKESESILYFRFYDPAALSGLERVMTSRQRQELFGPLTSILLESPDGLLSRLEPASSSLV